MFQLVASKRRFEVVMIRSQDKTITCPADCEHICYSLHYTFEFISLLEVPPQPICCDCLTFISLYYRNYTLVLRRLAT